MLLKILFTLAICLLCFSQNAAGQLDSAQIRLLSVAQSVGEFSKYLPQESVYLHFDNTSYYQGDDIWFACHVVADKMFKPTNLSETLYVELLNPGGELIDKRILKIDGFGRCHSNFTLNRLPFYSGFYEVRAYTKYMLNFGEDILFSRVFPVFEKPKTEGDFAERKMQKDWYTRYPEIRKHTKKEKSVNLKFYPEGGNLITGVESRIAFEATDEYGNPLNISGKIIDEAKQELGVFSTVHEGKGVFAYLPKAGKTTVIADNDGKEYKFDLPAAQKQGFVMTVDNLSNADSIGISIAKNTETAVEMLGIAILSRGAIQKLTIINSIDGTVDFKIDKTALPAGVSRIILYNQNGEILSDRLIFAGKPEMVDIQIQTDKETYNPYEKINLDISLKDRTQNPVQASFSLSVCDASNHVEYNRNMLTDLLLMSEIKGFVRNPKYYFENENREKELDLLLMVQGWRRYSWEDMTGQQPFDFRYYPEKGVTMSGKVVSMVRSKPKANVQVSCFISKRGEEDASPHSGESRDSQTNKASVDVFSTDSLGKFTFVTDLEGKWSLTMAVTEKGKAKDHRIVLDRLFSPQPRQYDIAETQIDIAKVEQETKDSETEEAEEQDAFDNDSIIAAMVDSLASVGITEKVHRLKEVVVKGKKLLKEQDIYEARRKSIAYYDVLTEVDKLKDDNEVMPENINKLLCSMNKNFFYHPRTDEVSYKKKYPLFVINYQRTKLEDYFLNKTHKIMRLEAIKSIYITEDVNEIIKYADSRLKLFEKMARYSCVVFIETPLEGSIMVEDGKGIRKTWFEGYTQPTKTFYSPDYAAGITEDDYRRTLYWNPAVMPDSTGRATISFYNNGIGKKLCVTAETVTGEGIVGIVK